MIVTPDKCVLQGVGFSCETGGNWSIRKKESKVMHLDCMVYTLVLPVYWGKGQIYRPIHTLLKEEGRVIDSRRIQGWLVWKLGMEDDTVNLIGVPKGLGDI